MDEQQPLDSNIDFWLAKHTAKEFSDLPEELQKEISKHYMKHQSLDFYRGMMSAYSVKGINPQMDLKFHLAYVSSIVVEQIEKTQ